MTIVPPIASADDELPLLLQKRGADPADRATRVQLARLYIERGDVDRALPFWQEADAIVAPEEPERMDRLTLLLNAGHLGNAAELVETQQWSAAEAYRLVAKKALDLNDLERAERIARAGTELFPQHAETRYVLAESLYLSRRLDDALAECARVVEADPKHQNALRIWAHVLSDQRKLRAAALKFQAAHDTDPALESVEAFARPLFFHAWGRVLHDLSRFDEALQRFRRAAELDPDDLDVRENIADAYWGMERWYEAMTGSRDLLERNPESRTPLVTMLMAQAAIGMTTQAAENLKKLCDIVGQESLPAGLMKAMFAWEQCRYAEARHHTVRLRALYHEQRAGMLDGTVDAPLDALAELALLILQDTVVAEQMLDDMGKVPAPIDDLGAVENHLLRARVLLARADMTAPHQRNERLTLRASAFAECRAAIMRVNDGIAEDGGRPHSEPELQFLLRALLSCEAPMGEIQPLLDAALKLPVKRSGTHAVIGLLQMKQKNYSSAILSFENAVNGDAGDIDDRILLAEALLRAGDLERSETEIRAILGRAPENIDARVMLGRLFIELGEKGDADAYSQAVTELNTAEQANGKETSSKLMNPRELANVQYLRGYARTKLYDEPKTIKDESLLVAAEQDFRNCESNDPENHRAASARRKINERLNPKTRGWISDRVAGAVCSLMSLSIFGTAGYRFADGLLSPGYAAVLMFGSLLFVIASFYLPQLLKLKVGSVELEKASLESSLARVPLQVRKAAIG